MNGTACSMAEDWNVKHGQSVGAKRILSKVLLVTAMMATGTAVAQTPDGETPANEGVCDVLAGGTPGLYGLCVAYCEAQDLDTMDKAPPNIKILENYRKKMKDGDPDMPCVKSPCACWSDEELASITSDGVAGACLVGDGTIQLVDTGVTHFALADTTRDQCGYVDLNLSPATVNFQTTLSAEDAQVCFDAVTAACASLGL